MDLDQISHVFRIDVDGFTRYLGHLSQAGQPTVVYKEEVPDERIDCPVVNVNSQVFLELFAWNVAVLALFNNMQFWHIVIIMVLVIEEVFLVRD